MPSRGLVSNQALLTAISLKAGSGDFVHLSLLPLNEEIRASEELTLFSIKFPKQGVVVDEVDTSLSLIKKWHKASGSSTLCMLGYDLDPKIETLKYWLKDYYPEMFSRNKRDIRDFEMFLQDVKAFNGESKYCIPNLLTFASSLGFEDPYAKIQARECLLLAEVYRRLLHKLG